MQPVIEVKKVGKRYNINHQRGKYVSLRDVIAYNVSHPLRFFKHRAKKTLGRLEKEEFWALRNVSFNVMPGEVVGIIGANGAGKSTLLKILTGITPPTEGEIILRGKVASLLEVGTGFHPELTGRENILLNGAILGMRRRETARKFDEIVAFAGVEKFIDTPVKYYSSGMYVRLAFSVAAHMEPDILLVDEVLAVGDAEFQKKCLGKMEEVTRQDGRTILFVSHNVNAIERLCTKVVLLQQGQVVEFGETKKVIEKYNELIQGRNLSAVSLKDRLNRTGGDVQFQKVDGIKEGTECWDFRQDEEVHIRFVCKAVHHVDNLLFYMALLDPNTNNILTNLHTTIRDSAVNPGEEISFTITIPPNTLRPGQFLLYVSLGNTARSRWYDVLDTNINLPALHIMPATVDPHDSIGLFTLPHTITLDE